METFFTATLTNDTPIFLGGYDTQYARDGITEGLRAQSLKGLIRYWMRVYLATAGYNLSEINSNTNKILGGKVGDGKIISSKVKLKCYTIRDNYRNIDKTLERVPRIKLLTLDKNRNPPNFADRVEAKISLHDISNSLDDKQKRLIIGSLVTGLLLSGLGKMGRRGFGCFSINIEEDDTRLFRTKVNELFSNKDIDKKIKLVKDLITIINNNLDNKNLKGLPPIHSFKNCRIFFIPLKNHVIKELASLQRFTVRGLRAIDLNQNPRKYKDDITKNHLAWFMGLPRSQKGTGYFINNELGRRASAMFIAIHRDFALVSFFKSIDWYNRITWKGGKGNKKIFTPNIEQAFNTTIASFLSYITQKGYEVHEIERVN